MPERIKKQELNVGIVGFGMIGKVHAYAYAALPYYLDIQTLGVRPRVAAVATAHPSSAESARRTIGCDRAVTDWRQITEDPAIDIVHICVPNGDHLPVLLSAIENNKAIYCEKPLVSTWREALRVEEALARTGYRMTNQMTFHLRFFPAVRRAKQLIDAGRLGPIFQYRVSYLHSSSANSQTPFKWKHAAGGGTLLDLGSHLFDLVDCLVGAPRELLAESQKAFASRPAAGAPLGSLPVAAEDAVTIVTRGCARDAEAPCRGLIEATKLATGREDELELEISGQNGAIRFSLLDPHGLEFYDARAADHPFGGQAGWLKIASGARVEPPQLPFPSAKSSVGWLRGHVDSLSNFLTALARGESTAPDLRQGIKIQRLLDRAAESAKRRSWVDAGEK